MQCIHLVRVKPIQTEKNLTLEPYHNWLREQTITRYRGGCFPSTTMQSGIPETIIFRFADVEDAVAFKLWMDL